MCIHVGPNVLDACVTNSTFLLGDFFFGNHLIWKLIHKIPNWKFQNIPPKYWDLWYPPTKTTTLVWTSPNIIEILILKFYCHYYLSLLTHINDTALSRWKFTSTVSEFIQTWKLRFFPEKFPFFPEKTESFKFRCQYVHNFLSSVVALKITSSIFPLIRLSSFYFSIYPLSRFLIVSAAVKQAINLPR